MAFRAGIRNQKITLLRVVESSSTIGRHEEAREPLATAWAAVILLKGGERYASGRLAARNIYRFELPYIAGVDETCLIIWQGQTLNIRSVDPSRQQADELVLEAESGTPEEGLS